MAHRPARRNFWIQWVLATVVSGYAVRLAYLFLIRLIGMETLDPFLIYPTPLGLFLNGVISPAVVGFVQSLVMSQYISKFRGWVSVSVVGAFIGYASQFLLTIFFIFKPQPVPNWLLTTLTLVSLFLPSMSIGIAQWLLLKKYVYKSGWWLITNIGSSIPVLILLVIVYPLAGKPISDTMLWTIIQILSLVSFAAIQATALDWLLRRRR